MKLRIHGNSVRLRFSRSEVDRLAGGERIEERVETEPLRLKYSAGVTDAASPDVGFDGRVLKVDLPAKIVSRWAKTDQVGIEHVCQRTGTQLTIEKDFKCLHGPGVDEPDAFPNPRETAAASPID